MSAAPSHPAGPTAVLYLPAGADADAACADLAGQPAAARTALLALRGGCSTVRLPIALQGTEVHRALDAASAGRGRVTWAADGAPAPLQGPTVFLPAGTVIPVDALRALLRRGGEAMLAGAPPSAPVGVTNGALALSLAAAGDAAIGPALAQAFRARGAAILPSPWCVVATDAPTRAEAERRLYASLGSPVDSWLDRRLHRALSRHLTRAAVSLRMSANAVSVLSILVGLVAAWCWTRPTLPAALSGLGLYLLSVVLDHSDGEVARLTFSESRLGEWLDLTGDTVVHVLGAVALGWAAEQAAGAGLAAGALAGVGFLMSALLTKTAVRPGAGDRLDQTLAIIGTRDGFYLLLLLDAGTLALAPSGLPALMALAAAGAHVYWLSRLLASARRRRRGPRQRGADAPRGRPRNTVLRPK